MDNEKPQSEPVRIEIEALIDAIEDEEKKEQPEAPDAPPAPPLTPPCSGRRSPGV